jgi:anti-sigma B factor antagonist
MKLKTHLEQDSCIIELTGYLDASSSILFDQAVREAVEIGPRKLLIDFGQLDYISSAGLGVIISYIQDLNQQNIMLVLFNMPPKIRNVFDMLGLDSLVPIVTCKADAVVYQKVTPKSI